MNRKYLVGPFTSTFACWTYGNGVLPLLPLYAIERGATQTTSGLFLAFAFLCLALGTFAAGLLPKHFAHRRNLIAACGLLVSILTWLMSRTTTLLAFAGATGAVWFLCGLVFAQAATLTGLAAEAKDRGVAFGILGMTNGLGSLVGGIGVGYLADQLGFKGLFGSIAVFCMLIVVGGQLSIESPVKKGPREGPRPAHAIVGVLFFLLAAQVFLSLTNAAGSLGRSLAMNQYGFSKLTINLTASIGGLVSLFFPLLLGWLSDRIGRRWIMIGTYLLTAASLVLLAFSRFSWHFYVFAGLFAFLAIPFSIGPAYVMDLVPRESAARGVSLIQAMFWTGNIGGMAAGGFAFDKLGTFAPLLFSSLFPIAGIIFLLLIRERAAEN